MPKVISTDHLPARDRFDFWRDVICDAYLPIACETPQAEQFEGRITLDRLSRLDISRINGSPQRVTRRGDHIGRDTDSFFMLSLQLSDVCHLSQSGRSTVLQPGDFGLYSTNAPYEIQCQSAVDQLVVQIPADALLMRMPNAEMLTGLGVSAKTQIGGLVSSQLRQCAEQVAGQPELVQRHMQEMMVDLVAAGFSSLVEGQVELSRPEQMLLARAKSAIHDHLRDDRLNPGFVAEAMGMSQRNLSRVFQRENISLAAYIRHARLEAIAADLLDPALVTFSISQIACKWGISNFQHFSKLFKDTYGLTPRAHRATKRKLQ